MVKWYCVNCHTEFDQKEHPGNCTTCLADEKLVLNMEEGIPSTPEAIRDIARKRLKGLCAAYPSCDGNFDKVCQKEAYGKPIGFGGAGQGASFRNNAQALLNLKLKMRVVGEHVEPDTSIDFLGMKLDFPVMGSSTAGIEKYNSAMPEKDFCRAVVRGCREAGTIGWRGDTWFYTPENNPALEVLREENLKNENGRGIPIFKPRAQDVLKKLINMAEEAGCPAVGLDLDGCGSTIMARHGQPVFRKSVKDLKELIEFTSLPFITKGIMCIEDAEACAEAGAKVVSVSNHGGRVLDATPGVAEVLPEIASSLKGKVFITADGGVRTGYDVIKMIALGADVVLLGRDIIRASVGAGALGVKIHMEHIRKVFKKAMFMTGQSSVKDIDQRILC
ncbi:FMN-dependent dehydrogenase family protein (TIM barrel family protein) [Desulfamplus magnetovallimortis]|uniref:FMN-dependent dehydrogenase family protein (TIM barrel family protein) n=1 Tax=Desulfamplus magnetovallimortis TaxID=1246637 RepID=A0A1W1H8C8_9BACT|nr:alpha-hydroxy-acid oxidizing protein [Desulfamplus magnetovallimortis]SLM28635.1 FMN-dependent dehydrogenase family protein (TIM barrel family protein) [Desulfamplus magnetovallimortis]